MIKKLSRESDVDQTQQRLIVHEPVSLILWHTLCIDKCHIRICTSYGKHLCVYWSYSFFLLECDYGLHACIAFCPFVWIIHSYVQATFQVVMDLRFIPLSPDTQQNHRHYTSVSLQRHESPRIWYTKQTHSDVCPSWSSSIYRLIETLDFSQHR